MTANHRVQLREKLRQDEPVKAPGVYDGLSALLVEQAGFDCAFLSGACLSFARFGRPDMGLVTASEVAETVSILRDRVSLPLIVDMDTGFGNALNVQRTVRDFERAGASALQMEDQGEEVMALLRLLWHGPSTKHWDMRWILGLSSTIIPVQYSWIC